MKFGVVNKSTIVNRFVLHTLQRNITHLAVITRKTNLKLGGGGGDWKRAQTNYCERICFHTWHRNITYLALIQP